jgi:hypothetical protein
VSKRFYATEATLAKHPVKGVLGQDEWVDIFTQAGYYQQTWLQLGSAFANWENTHSAAAAKALVALYQQSDTPGNDNEFAVYNAVECTDVQWPTSWAVWDRDNTAVNKIAPFLTWYNAWFNGPCLYWPARAQKPVKIGSDGSGNAIRSALLIDETLDAATPFPGSLEVRKLFPHSVLLAEPGGTTHADSLRRRRDRQLPGDRQAAAAQGPRRVGYHLPPAASPEPDLLDGGRLRGREGRGRLCAPSPRR